MGDAWGPAVELLQGLAVAAALAQVGFNWFSFYRAPAHAAAGGRGVVAAVGFCVLAVPGLAWPG